MNKTNENGIGGVRRPASRRPPNGGAQRPLQQQTGTPAAGSAIQARRSRLPLGITRTNNNDAEREESSGRADHGGSEGEANRQGRSNGGQRRSNGGQGRGRPLIQAGRSLLLPRKTIERDTAAEGGSNREDDTNGQKEPTDQRRGSGPPRDRSAATSPNSGRSIGAAARNARVPNSGRSTGAAASPPRDRSAATSPNSGRSIGAAARNARVPSRRQLPLNRSREERDEEEETRQLRLRVDPERQGSNRKGKKIFHTLHNTSKNLSPYLLEVPDGIKKAAQACGIELDAGDIQKLNQFCGDCPHYMPYESKQGNGAMKTKQSTGKTKEEIYAIYAAKNRYLVPKSPRFSPNLADKTSGNYENWVRGLWNFCAYTGRYAEMILLLPHPPKIPDDVVPSITPETICEFVHHRFEPAGHPLKERGEHNGERLRDCKGRVMECEGSVQNIEWFDSLFAAVTAIHDKALKGNRYVPPCKQCLATPGRQLCRAHVDCGKTKVHYTRSQGNPVLCKVVDELKGWLLRVSKDRQYQPKRRSPFLPNDIIQFQRALDCANFEVCQLASYTSLLLAINVAGRWDGYSSIDVEQNINATSRHWVVQGNRILNFAIRIKEKTDDDFVSYRVIFDDTVPKMCWARHILVYSHCAGVSSGFLFPHKSELEDARRSLLEGNSDGLVATRTLDYQDFIRYIEQNKRYCKGSELANWGPHSPRCTKYLFDFIGGADLHLAAKTARHKSHRVAVKYLNDSQCIRDILNEHPALKQLHRVPPYRDTIISGNGENVERALLGLPNRMRGLKTLGELCAMFVKDMLGVAEDNAHYRDPEYLLKRSYGMKLASTATAGTDIHTNQIRALVPEAQQYALLQSYQHVTKQAEQEADMQKQAAVEENVRLAKVELRAQAREREEVHRQRQVDEYRSFHERRLLQLEERYRRNLEAQKAEWESQKLELHGQLQRERQRRQAAEEAPANTTKAGTPAQTNSPQVTSKRQAEAVMPAVSPAQALSPAQAGEIPTQEISPLAEPRTRPGRTSEGTPAVAPALQDEVTPSPTVIGLAKPAPPKHTNADTSGAEAAPPNELIPLPAVVGLAMVPRNPYAKPRRALIMGNVVPDADEEDSGVECPPFDDASGDLIRVSLKGGVTQAHFSETTMSKIKSAKEKDKAALLVDLILETGELVLDASMSHQQCYEAGKQLLYKSLAKDKKARSALQTYVNRTLKPLEHHFFVCCKGNKPAFLESFACAFRPTTFATDIKCEPCIQYALQASNSARRNAKKRKKTMDDFLQGSGKKMRT